MSIYEYTPALVYFTVLAAAAGAAAGSFLNCAAYRITHGESFLKGRSRCPACGHVLGFLDLIPVAGWLLLGGRCRYCKEKISVRYLLTECAFAAVTVLCLLRFDLTFLFLRNFLFLCCLFLLSLTDLEEMIIPDGCHIAGILFWAAGAVLSIITGTDIPFTGGGVRGALTALLSAVLYGGGLLAISLVMDKLLGRESLGGGDIKLTGVIALYLGPAGTLFMIILACILGLAAVGLAGYGERKAFPFGPWLSLSAAGMLLFGEGAVIWYLGLLGMTG